MVYIALLRGINVGGRNKLPMIGLVAALEEAGARSVSTLIQSGNAVFRYAEGDPQSLALRVSRIVEREFGFGPRVIVFSRREFDQSIESNPFPDAESHPAHLHVGFLESPAPVSPHTALEKLKANGEMFHLSERVFYLAVPNGIGRSELYARAEKAIGAPMTLRNWNTVLRIAEMARSLAATETNA